MSDARPLCSTCGTRTVRSIKSGLCNSCMCKKRYYSPGVREKDIARAMRNWEKRKSDGLCVNGCGSSPASGRVMCSSCGIKNAKLVSSRKLRLNSLGMCRECGTPTIGGKVSCESCIEKLVVNCYKKYGITKDKMVELRARAKVESCCICGRHPSDSYRKVLAIDHAHIEPPTFRGLICSQCNHGLGNFSDSPSTLRAAADYLERTDPRYRKPEPTE